MNARVRINATAVVLRDVSVRFGSHLVLNQVNLACFAGSVCAIVGANGAGKTTLLRVLAGALAPSSGTVSKPIDTRRGSIAIVAQTIALYPFLTLRENCLAFGRIEGLRGSALVARADAAIAQTVCAEMQDQLAGRLSGGFQRRAAIAAALMGDASLLILDEPTTGLDAEAAQAIVAIIRKLRDAGKSVVLSTHDFAFADAVADDALFLRGGCVIAAGSPRRMCDELDRNKKHVEFILADEPTPRQVELLRTIAACKLSALRYCVISDDAGGGELEVVRHLRDASMSAIELRIREMGMATLFARFCLNEDRS